MFSPYAESVAALPAPPAPSLPLVSAPIGDVLVDGHATHAAAASLSIFDIGFQRGYGCFEAMRSYRGSIFRLSQHLDRLASSARKLHLDLPDAPVLAEWCRSVASGDSIVRVLVSGGTDTHRVGTAGHVFVYAETIDPFPEDFSVQLRVAPWHSDGTVFELTGAKALSYGFNLAATVAARAAGFDDALLVGESGSVLEGPTYSIGWVKDGVIRTPGLELGILESITRQAVLDACEHAGIQVAAGAFGVGDLYAADEVLMMSTVREVMPVAVVDDRRFPKGPVTGRVAGLFRALIVEELG